MFRKHLALSHHDDDALQPEREATRRDIFAEKHSDEVVVTPAATETSGEVGNTDFNNRAGVVREPARQRRIDLDPTCSAARSGKCHDRLQFVNSARAGFIVAYGFD